MIVPLCQWTQRTCHKVSCARSPGALRAAVRAAMMRAVVETVEHLDAVIMDERSALGQRVTLTLPGGMRLRCHVLVDKLPE